MFLSLDNAFDQVALQFRWPRFFTAFIFYHFSNAKHQLLLPRLRDQLHSDGKAIRRQRNRNANRRHA